MFRVSTIVALLALAAPLAAQEIKFSGEVEDGKAVCYYCPGFDFVLKDTHASIHSSTVNLTPLIGQYVTGTGVWNGSFTLPVIDVLTVQVVAQGFSINGSGTIGTQMKFTAVSAPGDLAVIALAFLDGFAPVMGGNALFLSTQSLFIAGQGVVDGAGEFQIKANVPNNPVLIGLNVFGQAGIVGTGGAVSVTNSDRKVIN